MSDGADVMGRDHLKACLRSFLFEDGAADFEVTTGEIETGIPGGALDLLFGEPLDEGGAQEFGRNARLALGMEVDGLHRPQHFRDLLVAFEVGVVSTSKVIEQGHGLFLGQHLMTITERVCDDVRVPGHRMHQSSMGVRGIVLSHELVTHDVDAPIP